MSFSSMTPIEAPHFKMIRTIVRQRGFLINDNKIAWFGPDDDKVVTGIVVKPNTLELLPTFIPALEVEIQEFKAIVVSATPFATPCGACRQFIVEFGKDIEVVCVDANDPSHTKAWTINELIPENFKF